MSQPIPPTAKQVAYAKSLALQTHAVLPWEAQQSRYALSRWIDAQREVYAKSDVAQRPSSKQVAFAERIARLKRTKVPEECFASRQLMSRWIDRHAT